MTTKTTLFAAAEDELTRLAQENKCLRNKICELEKTVTKDVKQLTDEITTLRAELRNLKIDVGSLADSGTK